jgi:hypothetical protein
MCRRPGYSCNHSPLLKLQRPSSASRSTKEQLCVLQMPVLLKPGMVKT